VQAVKRQEFRKETKDRIPSSNGTTKPNETFSDEPTQMLKGKRLHVKLDELISGQADLSLAW
jgi:hypothetical protein